MNVSSALTLSTILHEIEEFGVHEVHLTRHGDLTRIRYRVDGLLRTAHVMPAAKHAGLLLRLKSTMGDDYSLRTFRSLDGEHGVLHRRCGEAESLEELGFATDDAAQVGDVLKAGRGLVLVIGPPGSGRSTTLHVLDHLAAARGARVKYVAGSNFDLAPAIHDALAGHVVGSETDENDDLEAALSDKNVSHLIESVPSVAVNQCLLRRPCADCAGDESRACERSIGSGCARCRGTGYFGQSLASSIQPLSGYSRARASEALRERALSLVQDKRATLEEVSRLRL